VKRRAVFLDRDGTILQQIAYLHQPELVRLVPGAAGALRRLEAQGWLRILVTNQSGVARGMFSLEDVAAVNDRMRNLLQAGGADLEGIEICPHHPDYTGPCDCRKPASGLVRRAAKRYGIDLACSWMIGDRLDDLAAGRVLGLRTILVRTGYGREEERAATPEQLAEITRVVDDLPAACDFLLAASPCPGSSPAGDPNDPSRSSGV
jgi:D-glycero-D-manno-heptose 1,7-bisphosphate phosphatase